MEQISAKRKKRNLILRIDIPALLAVSFFAGLIFLYLIPGFEKVMMDRKRNLIHEMTSSAFSLLEYYHSLELKGELKTEEAKELAKAAISKIRYGETLKDYFWISDLYPRMIIHPYRPDLNGTDLTSYLDSNGKQIFVEFVKSVSRSGESYVDYMWQWNDDSTRNVPKLSYVKLFKPWGWIIGTGIYIEDVKSEIQHLELRALIISGSIGVIIIILLILISGQSHKIEQKRGRAEEELQQSKELYRSLAEASSEGVLIWSEQGLQANKILLSWLDYTEDELNRIHFQDILRAPEFNDAVDSDTLYNELNSRRYVDTFLKIRNGNLIRFHADFSRIIMGEIRAVLVVLRPGSTLNIESGFTLRQSLLNDIGTGFFRTTYGRRSRFLYASQPAVKMLGFDNFQDLHSHSIESFFVNQLQLEAFRSALASRENVSGEKVLLKQKGGKEFWALVSVILIESDSNELWCEGTIEHISASAFPSDFTTVDLNTYGAIFVLKCPVSSIMRPPVICSENQSVASAMMIMKEKGTHLVLVVNKDKEPLGVADAGVIGLRLAGGGLPETEIFRWMSSPPDYISQNSTIDEAFGMIGKSMKKCLIVINEENQTTGIITSEELSQAFYISPQLILSEIEDANSSSDLKRAFLDSRKIAISMILGSADPYSISLFISSVADAICCKVITLCLEEAGNPPCRFAFIQTGSAGRGEQTLSTDQDNAIIFENCYGEQLNSANNYFLSLGKKVNGMLNIAGFRFCKGENMAGNPKWCQPVDKWKKYFSDWIRMPGPDELLEVGIFFDFRFCYGDRTLSDELSEFIRKNLKTSDIFFHHMAASWKPFRPSLANTSEGKTDIKRILMPLTGIIRLYSLKYGVTGYSSIDRILGLYSFKHLDDILLRETIRAWRNLTSLRLSHQASCINNGTDPDNIIDFKIASPDLQYFAVQSIATIDNLLLKTGSDFYTTTI